MRSAAVLAVLSAFCACAVSFDLRTGRIPNWLNALGLLGGTSFCAAAWGLPGLRRSLSGALLGAALLLPFFLLRMVGAGDVKFLCAAGSLVGWRLLGPSFLLGAAVGGAAGLALLVMRGGGTRSLLPRLALLEAGGLRGKALRPGRAGSGLPDLAMPYALPLSLGLISITITATVMGRFP